MTFTDKVNAAIAAGSVRVVDATVTATINGKEETRAFQKLEAVTLDGARAICDGRDVPNVVDGKETREMSVVGEFNYAYDLRQRARERAALVSQFESPEKQYLKAAKPLVALGFYATEEEAVAAVKAQKEALEASQKGAETPAS